MNIQVKNSIKPIDYIQSMNELEKRVHEVMTGKEVDLLWILEQNSKRIAPSRHG